MMPFLWLWWQGYLIVRLRGAGLEKVLNRAAQEGIVLYGIERPTCDVILARIKAADFSRLRPLLRELGPGLRVDAAILDRHGLPFLGRKFKRRAFLALGCALAALLTVYLSNFVWFIQVFGNERLAVEVLKLAVEQTGLRTGLPRKAVDARAIERQLLASLPSLAWVQVETQGILVKVHVRERDLGDLDAQVAGHVYAKRDGLITELLVLQGTPQVKEGDTVREGDLLISGMYYDWQGRRHFGAARGVVKARVWYQAVGEAGLLHWEAEKTGKKHRQYILGVGSLRIPLGRSYSRASHLVTSEKWQLSLGSALAPLSWTVVDYEEVEWTAIPLSPAEVEQVAYELAWENLLNQGVNRENVIAEKRTVEPLADGLGLRVTVQVEVLEDIGEFLGQ